MEIREENGEPIVVFRASELIVRDILGYAATQLDYYRAPGAEQVLQVKRDFEQWQRENIQKVKLPHELPKEEILAIKIAPAKKPKG